MGNKKKSDSIKEYEYEYVSATKDIMGDIEKIKIKCIATGETKSYTPEKIKAAAVQGLIRYIKVSSKGKVYITKRKPIKRKVEEHRKKLEDIIKQISSLEKKAPGDRKSKDKIIQLKRELEKLLEKKEYLDAYEAIVRSEARAYKDNKRGKKKN